MIAWVVKKGRERVYFSHFGAAWWDWKSHAGEFRLIYPVVVEGDRFLKMKEHRGW